MGYRGRSNHPFNQSTYIALAPCIIIYYYIVIFDWWKLCKLAPGEQWHFLGSVRGLKKCHCLPRDSFCKFQQSKKVILPQESARPSWRLLGAPRDSPLNLNLSLLKVAREGLLFPNVWSIRSKGGYLRFGGGLLFKDGHYMTKSKVLRSRLL